MDADGDGAAVSRHLVDLRLRMEHRGLRHGSNPRTAGRSPRVDRVHPRRRHHSRLRVDWDRPPGHRPPGRSLMTMIRPLDKADTDECDRIIASLGDWFGNEEGIRQASAAGRSQPGLVADDGMTVVGFTTWVKHSEAAA